MRLAEDLKIPVNDIKKYFEEFQVNYFSNIFFN
jgi:hypothetical protein